MALANKGQRISAGFHLVLQVKSVWESGSSLRGYSCAHMLWITHSIRGNPFCFLVFIFLLDDVSVWFYHRYFIFWRKPLNPPEENLLLSKREKVNFHSSLWLVLICETEWSVKQCSGRQYDGFQVMNSKAMTELSCLDNRNRAVRTDQLFGWASKAAYQ